MTPRRRLPRAKARRGVTYRVKAPMTAAVVFTAVDAAIPHPDPPGAAARPNRWVDPPGDNIIHPVMYQLIHHRVPTGDPHKAGGFQSIPGGDPPRRQNNSAATSWFQSPGGDPPATARLAAQGFLADGFNPHPVVSHRVTADQTSKASVLFQSHPAVSHRIGPDPAAAPRFNPHPAVSHRVAAPTAQQNAKRTSIHTRRCPPLARTRKCQKTIPNPATVSKDHTRW